MGRTRTLPNSVTAVDDPDLAAYFTHCVDLCREEFGRWRKDLPAPFAVSFGGTVPRFQVQQGAAQATITLTGSDWWQTRFEAGHEVLHWFATPPGAQAEILHWTHEMFAVEISVLCLRRYATNRALEHAEKCEQWLEQESARASLEEMLTTPLVEPYDRFFGRAFVTGRALQHAVSWERLKPLAFQLDGQQRPDLRRWLNELPGNLRRSAYSVLGEPTDAWV